MKNSSLWKKLMVCVMLTSFILSMAGCGKKAEEKPAESAETQTAEAQEASGEAEEDATSLVTDGIKIDYKSSSIYTEDEMNLAIEEIMKEFNSWDGCEMHEISYTDDKTCEDNLSYVNELGMDDTFVNCIVFTSSFHSPKNGGGAWEADYEYEGWQWYLGRTEEGEWNLLTWGY